MESLKRRDFIKSSSALVGAAALTSSSVSSVLAAGSAAVSYIHLMLPS
ncbi:twin-arginine translocation signal domain-containing protein [Sphingobacterium daejeonense]